MSATPQSLPEPAPDGAPSPKTKGSSQAELGRNRRVPCEHCGKEFSPRGLAGHMRLKHGVQAAPKAPLPSQGPDVVATLGAVLSALTRIEAKLDDLEVSSAAAAVDPRTGLAEELRGVLANIEHFREPSAEEDAIGQAARFRRLGLLRRRQAELLYELGPEGGVTPDELLGS